MCRTVAVNGIEYTIGDVVITAMGVNDVLKFFDILNILVVEKTVLFVGKHLEALYFDNHYNAYVVERVVTAAYDVLTQNSLLDGSALGIIQGFWSDTLYVPLRHWVCGP